MKDFLYEALMEQNTLCHHGILGQKWGIRRYQNHDGSLTPEGRKRYKNIVGRYDSNSNSSLFMTKKVQKAKELLEKDKSIMERKKQKSEKFQKDRESANDYAKTLEKSGWKVDVDRRPAVARASAESDGKFGDNKVTFNAYYNAELAKTNGDKAARNANLVKKRYEKEYKKVLSTTTEQLAKDYYDSGQFRQWHSGTNTSKWTRDDFKSEVSKLLNSVDLQVGSETPGGAELWFNDGKHMTNLFDYHSLSVEYNINEDKAYRSSLNG